jgi:hypothetical protein
MPAINTFNDFMTATGPSYLKGADKVINEAVKNTYAFSRLLKNKTTEQTIQGGTEIRDVIMFDDARTFGFYQPNDTFTWSNPQVTDYVKAPWRFSIDHMSWTDHEVQLNTSENAASTKVMYKRLKRIKEQRMWTSMFNGFEESLWAPPNQAQMEADSGRLAYSLPFFITELASFSASLGRRGTFPFTAAANTGNTVMRLNPSLTAGEPRWTNQVELYNCQTSALTPLGAEWDDVFTASLVNDTVYSQQGPSGAVNTTHSVGNIFNAMDVMFMRLKYEAPASRQQYFENDALNRQMILTSRLGVQQYRNALRLSNDTLVSYQDPSYSSPQYAGIDVTYCSDLDSAAIFPAHSTTVTQGIGASAGINGVTAANGAFSAFGTELGANTIVRAPRYYFVNGNYLTPIFHSTRYFQTHDVMTHPNQPFTKVMPVDCWWNLFCNSRQRHGIVAPINMTAA